MVRRFIFQAIAILFLISACSSRTPQVFATIIPTGVITPYLTVTPTIFQPSATVKATIPVTPVPTSTPFLHTITDKDTMLGIAYQYGITLEELQAANPGVDPRFLSVGKQLVIPIGGEMPETMPAPTAVMVQMELPRCFQAGDGGAWCFIVVQNDLEFDIENLSAWIGLFTPNGKEIKNQVAFAPLNLLKSGDRMPLLTYFSPPIPDKFQVYAELLSGLAVAQEDPRYLDLQVDLQPIIFSSDGSEAIVEGSVIVPGDQPFPSQLWVMAAAYDDEGNIVGVRKWESMGEARFKIIVSSMKNKIGEVDVLTEARP